MKKLIKIKYLGILLGIVVITVTFIEAGNNSYNQSVGQELRTAINSLGPRFDGVKIIYSKSGGIIVSQNWPSVVTGKVPGKSDIDAITNAVSQVCAKTKYERKITINVDIENK
ncbi:MAG: hypothetical protein HY811_00745 [Planctomycetes bacterium]|nr:hypothetical protein [Planctomycetota bacterium]